MTSIHNNDTADTKNETKDKLNTETALIPWAELQRFFAQGRAIVVDASLDLIEVGSEMASDNAEQIQAWMTSGKISPVSDQQAQTWLTESNSVWAVVIKPWVLVQPAQ